MTLRNILLGATMLCAATAPAYAFAQDAAPADDAAAPADSYDYGNEIIVTASKRSQTLQDTPVAVSVTSAANLQNSQIRDPIDLQSSVPRDQKSVVQGKSVSVRGDDGGCVCLTKKNIYRDKC